MTSDSDEMSYYTSLLAHNPQMHRKMAAAVASRHHGHRTNV